MNFFVVTICQSYLPNRMTVPYTERQVASGMSDKKCKLAAKKFLWSAILFVVLSGRSKAHSLSRLGELHVKAGYVSTLLAGWPG